MMPDEVSKLAKEQMEKVRRMTNLELWQRMLDSASCGEDYLVEREFEWRLRKLGFLPALPLKEE